MAVFRAGGTGNVTRAATEIIDRAPTTRIISPPQTAALASYSLVASTGANPALGATAALVKTWRTTAVGGTLALGAPSGSTNAARRTQGLTGGVSLAGATAALTKTQRLSAASAAAAANGSAATLSRQLRLTAISGSAPLSGTVAAQRTTHYLAAGVGSVQVPGAPAAVRAAHRLNSASGAVSAIGAIAPETVSRKLFANVGTIPVGQAVGQVYQAHRLVASAGFAPNVGTAARLASSRRLQAGSGKADAAGTSAGLTYVGLAPILRVLALTAVPSSVPVLGSTASFTRALSIRSSSPSTGTAMRSGTASFTSSGAAPEPVVVEPVTPQGGWGWAGIAGQVKQPKKTRELRRLRIVAAGGSVPIEGTPATLVRSAILAGGRSSVLAYGSAGFVKRRAIVSRAPVLGFEGSAQMRIERFDWTAYDNDFLLAA